MKDDEQDDTENASAGPDYLQGALVSMDPTSGAVRALVGGRDFDESRFNRATQARRQSGSAFKPFVYAAALEAGYSPASLITHLNDPIATEQGDWVPEDEHSSATEMTMRSALRMSSNRAAVQMLDTIGIPAAVKYAEKLKVGTPPSVPSLALGASDVSLMSLTAAYGAFADKGLLHTPSLVRRVEDSDGKVLYENPDSAARDQRGNGVPHVEHARRRHQRRHGVQGPSGRLHAAGGGEDRHDERLRRRLVHRLHDAPRHGRMGRLRPARRRSSGTATAAISQCRSGPRS